MSTVSIMIDPVRYGSVCSGIEATTVAWRDLGWSAAFYSEIDAFPCALLAHYYDTPNFGDMTRFAEWPDAAIDVLVGGTPCQSFSVAGLRKGLADPRGNLALTFLAIADRYRPEWLVWENVPGVLSSDGGRDFAAFLSGLGQLGYGWAYRVLDAQHFGVPQRRRRVFVVGCARGWAYSAAVLFERESLSGHPAPRREAREKVAAPLATRAPSGSNATERRRDDAVNIVAGTPQANHGNIRAEAAWTGQLVARCDTAREGSRQDYETETLIAHSLRADGFDASEDGTGRGTPLVPISFHARQDPDSGTVTHPLDTDGQSIGVLAFDTTQITHPENRSRPDNRSPQLSASAHPPAVAMTAPAAVRRLTPRECERLMGFPDDYTLIPYRGKPAADGNRYKALGNSMAVPVVKWLGERIALVRSLQMEIAA